jgi:hypothetical protein
MWHQAKIILGLVLLGSVIQSVSAQAGAGFPVVDGKAVLTVSGEGYRHRQIYENGEQPALSGYDSSGQQLLDGEYRYQLRSIPADSVATNTQQQLLSGKATTSKTGKTSSSSIQSGKFDVQGGAVIYR